ncbi:MAG: hypothetical protein HYZ25_10115 [Chloroflexi bacterium]|nr:hypothetical protein [Chloroflexota bacterium]
MKNISLISLLLILLTACAAPVPSPTMTVMASPTFTSTAMPEATPTPTFVATITEEAVEVEKSYLTNLHLKETDTIENYQYGKNGPVVSASVYVDQSAWIHGVQEVTMPDELLAELNMRALHALFMPNEADDEASLKTFAERWSKVQKGELPAKELEVTVNIFDANKNATEGEQVMLALGEVGEDVVNIKSVAFVVGAFYDNPEQGVTLVGKDTPWFFKITPSGSGAGALLDKNIGKLYIFIGLSDLVTKDRSELQVPTYFELAITWLKYFGNNDPAFTVSNTQKYADRGRKLISKGLTIVKVK